jgi:hypothetical protein
MSFPYWLGEFGIVSTPAIVNPTKVLVNGLTAFVALQNANGSSTTIYTSSPLPAGTYLFNISFFIGTSSTVLFNTDEFIDVQLSNGNNPSAFFTGAPYYLSDEAGTNSNITLTMSGLMTLSSTSPITVDVVRKGNVSTNKVGAIVSIVYNKLD